MEKDPTSLDVNTFDLEFEVDPLFKKTSAAFDEGNVEGLLLSQIPSRFNEYSYRLVLCTGGVCLQVDYHTHSLPIQRLHLCSHVGRQGSPAFNRRPPLSPSTRPPRVMELT